MTKHLFSLSSLLTLCLYLSGSHYNLTKYAENLLPHQGEAEVIQLKKHKARVQWVSE